MARISNLFILLKKELGDIKMKTDKEFFPEDLSDQSITKFINSLSNISDKRHSSYIKYPVQEILFISFFAVLSNANNWIEIGRFAQGKQKWIGQFFGHKNGIPSHDTIQRTMILIQPEELHAMLSSYIINIINELDELGRQISEENKEIKELIEEKEILSIDGKISRGSSRIQTKDGKTSPLNTLSAYSSKYGMSLSQEYIDGKTNEIPATPELLKRLNINGMIVTWDALNTQKETVKAVIKGKGDYVAALKANQHNLYKDVELYFDTYKEKELKSNPLCYKRTQEKSHGNIEIREYFMTEDMEWLSVKKDWAGLKSLGWEKKTIKKPDGTSISENRYYISSLDEEIELFAKAVRKHWQVENNLHWQLDFTFKEDANTTMEKRGAKTLGVIKRNVLTMLQLVKDYYKMSMSLIRYQMSLNFEEEVEKMFDLLDISELQKAYESSKLKTDKS